MKTYKYSARTKEGAIYKGKMEARSTAAVIDSLQGKEMVVLEVQEDIGLSLARLKEINIGGVPLADKVIFMRQLATMISAGLPLTQALEILGKQATNPLFKKVLEDVLGDVEGGTSLAESFKKNSEVFDEISINLIEAGEQSGHLEEVLQRLAVELENQKKLQEKIKSAMIYPVIIVIVIIAVVVLLLVVLIPAMNEIYQQFDAELPLVTRMLISMSDFILNFWWLVAIIIAIFIMAFKYYAETPKGKISIAKTVLKLPVFGTLIVKIQLTQFNRVLGLLLRSGLSIVEALRLTSNSLSNLMFKEAVDLAKEEVEKGTPLAVPLARSEYFPLIVSQMVAVGEESGSLDMILDKMAQYYAEEVDVMTENLSTLLEPIILVVMGVVIGFIAMAVYMPMFNLAQVIG